MKVRSLLPWLLTGALVASVYLNVSLFQAPPSAPDLATGRLPAAAPETVPSFHLVPGELDAHCPIVERLGLSEDQRDQIQRCSLSSLKLRTDLAVEISDASTKLDKLMSADAVDGRGILALANEISTLRGRQYKAWIGSILVIRGVLTPEQLQLLHSIDPE